MRLCAILNTVALLYIQCCRHKCAFSTSVTPSVAIVVMHMSFHSFNPTAVLQINFTRFPCSIDDENEKSSLPGQEERRNSTNKALVDRKGHWIWQLQYYSFLVEYLISLNVPAHWLFSTQHKLYLSPPYQNWDQSGGGTDNRLLSASCWAYWSVFWIVEKLWNKM